MAITALELQRLYLAYFGRPADRDGMAFYLAPGTDWKIFAGPPDVTVGFSESLESRALYGTSFGAEQIDAIYMNLFNRHAEPDGIAYWLGQVQKGELTPAGAAYGILVGAQHEDAVAVANKLALCQEFFAAVDTPAEIAAYRGDEAAALIRTFIHSVDHTSASLTNARNALAGKIEEMLNPEPPLPEPVNLPFTTGQDDLKGGEADDTFTAVAGGTTPTFSAADRLDGGDGEDTLRLTLEDAGANSVEAAQVRNVETVQVRNLSGQRQTVDAANFEGARVFTAGESDAALEFVNLRADQVASLEGLTASGLDTDVAFRYAAGVAHALFSPVDSVAGELRIGGVNVEDTVMTMDVTGAPRRFGELVLTGQNHRRLQIEVEGNGAPLVFDRIDSEAQDVVVTLEAADVLHANVVFGAFGAGITKLDVSKLPGGAGLGVEVFAAEEVFAGQAFEFIGTGGDDVYHVRGTLDDEEADGGAGRDTLVVAGDATITDGRSFSGFERAEFRSGVELDVSKLGSDVDELVIHDDEQTMSVNLTGMTVQQLQNIVVTASNAGQAGGITLGLSSPVDLVKIRVGGTQEVGLGRLSAVGARGVEVVADGDYSIDELVTSSLSASYVGTGGGNARVFLGSNSVADTFAFDFSAATGSLHLDATGARQSDGAGLVIRDSQAADTVFAGFGSDRVIYTGGADTLTLGAGGDTFDFNGKKGSDAMQTGVTFKVTALDSHAAARPPGEAGPDTLDASDVDPLATDSIRGVQIAPFTASTGTRFVIDSDLDATSLDVATQLTFGVTQVSAQRGFLTVRMTGATDTVYVFQDGSDEDLTIDRDELMVQVVGIGTLQSTEFVREGGNLVFTSL